MWSRFLAFYYWLPDACQWVACWLGALLVCNVVYLMSRVAGCIYDVLYDDAD